MHAVYFVAALAVVQFFFFAALVAKARATYGVRAPATTGHAQFERIYRVQMNTLEQLLGFLPALLIAAQYWSPPLMAAIGAVYLVGRLLFWRGYVRDPRARGTGFLLSLAPTLILLTAALLGAVLGMLGMI